MKNVVTIGGGTGQYTLLRGLKNYDINLTAIVSTVDNGGSTGRLRTEFGIFAHGDLRNCLVALSNRPKMAEFFEYRYPDGELNKHNLGNLILTAATHIYDPIQGIKEVSDMLEISGTVLPISPDSTKLFAKTYKGDTLEGQVNVSYPSMETRISDLWLDPHAFVYGEAAKAIRDADVIVVCPGDLYGSVLPNFLVNGVNDSINQSSCKKIYVCNLVTKQGSFGFKASDFVGEIEKYSASHLDCVICNNKEPTQRVVDKYCEENSFFVEPDSDNINSEVFLGEFLVEYISGNKIIARHNTEKIARAIMDFV